MASMTIEEILEHVEAAIGELESLRDSTEDLKRLAELEVLCATLIAQLRKLVTENTSEEFKEWCLAFLDGLEDKHLKNTAN